MSFDIFFQPCRFGLATVDRLDAQTGQTRRVLPNHPLTEVELVAVQKVLAKRNALGPDQFGCYNVNFEDGGFAEVFGSNLETGCMVVLRGMTRDTTSFLYELLQAGNWIMVPAMQETRAIATSLDAFKQIPPGFPPTVACSSPDELEVMLGKGFDAWKAYRDHVVGLSRQS